MVPSYFYHGLIRKYVIYFGTLFNDISIERTDEGGNTIQDFVVPIAYGPRQKFIARLEQDPTLNKSVALTLPRMSFEIVDFEYDPSRKLPSTNKILKQSTNYTGKLDSVYNPVPVNIKFALAIYTRNAEDGFKIFEQILPYFTPEWTSTLNILPEMDLKVDVPVVMNDINMVDKYEGSFEDLSRRYIIHTLTFTMKGYLFGPTSRSDIIRKAIVNLYNNQNVRTANLTIQNYITQFKPGDFIYQTNGSTQTASGIVKEANTTFLYVINVNGKFNTANNVLCGNSNAVGDVSAVSSADTVSEVITVRPGLTNTGKPTANLSLSIDLDLIKSTDDYGINISISEP